MTSFGRQRPGADSGMHAARGPMLARLRFVIWQSGQRCSQIGGSNQRQAGHCQEAGRCAGQINNNNKVISCLPSPRDLHFLLLLRVLPFSSMFTRASAECETDLCVCVFFSASNKLNRPYVFPRPGWPILTVVLRERRTSELCLQRPNASLICARTPKRGTTYCAPSARSRASPPGWWSYANSRPPLLLLLRRCTEQQRCVNVILRCSFCRLKLHPHASSWRILPPWILCCCLSTLGARPAIRFRLFLRGVVGLWDSPRFTESLGMKPKRN